MIGMERSLGCPIYPLGYRILELWGGAVLFLFCLLSQIHSHNCNTGTDLSVDWLFPFLLYLMGSSEANLTLNHRTDLLTQMFTHNRLQVCIQNHVRQNHVILVSALKEMTGLTWSVLPVFSVLDFVALFLLVYCISC